MWNRLKESIVRFLVFVLFLFVAIGVLFVFLSQSAEIAAWASAALLLVAIVGVRKGEPGTKFRIAASALAVASLIALISYPSFRNSQRARFEEAQSQAFAQLRETNPQQYLDELKRAKSARFLEEARLLNPSIYEAELKARDQARREEIERIKVDLASRKASDSSGRMSLYRRLIELDPSNSEFKKQRDLLQAQVRQEEILADVRRRPEHYLELSNFSWTKVGFGTVMEADFTIRNSSTIVLKDPTITCNYFGASGTKIDSSQRTIYQSFRSGEKRTIRKFNMGFVHSQAVSGNCSIVGAAY